MRSHFLCSTSLVRIIWNDEQPISPYHQSLWLSFFLPLSLVSISIPSHCCGDDIGHCNVLATSQNFITSRLVCSLTLLMLFKMELHRQGDKSSSDIQAELWHMLSYMWSGWWQTHGVANHNKYNNVHVQGYVGGAGQDWDGWEACNKAAFLPLLPHTIMICLVMITMFSDVHKNHGW